VAQLFFTDEDYLKSSSAEFQEFKGKKRSNELHTWLDVSHLFFCSLEFFQKYVQFKKHTASKTPPVDQQRKDLLKEITATGKRKRAEKTKR
jgi:hypothetical protein